MKRPYRLQQVLEYRRADGSEPPALPEDARARLTEHMAAQFSMLSAGDQRHLLRVYMYLKTAGAHDDTITAGLIHDVGKACRKCSITIVDRSLHVVCSRFLSGPYARFAALQGPPERLLGLHRLANHSKRGAIAAALEGYSDRVCWLIRHHEQRRRTITADPELLLLQGADDTADSSYDQNQLSRKHNEPEAPPHRASL